ncbi:MAG TPA: carotenoid biosynthesis protein [Desulfomonilia bacterium]|nr:carotenoid biosynthesis protein [Desulfomonilia bacterium]
MMDTALHRITPLLNYAAWLTLVPFFISLTLLGFCLSKGEVFRLKRYCIWAAVLAGIYALTLIPRTSVPLPLDTLRLIYEVSAVTEFIILALHGRTWLKRWDWLWIFCITLVFGMVLENGGILMGFFQEKGYWFYVPGLPAPVATIVGWVNVLYCGFFAVEKLMPEMRPFLRGLVCAVIALSMDIPFDPVATRLAWWVWNDRLTMSIWGVPVVNYVAWFWALFPYAWCYYRVRSYGKCEEGRKIALFSALIPLILVIELAGVLASLLILGDKEALEIVGRFLRSL